MNIYPCGNGIQFPEGGWKFDSNVAKVFQSHIQSSVPGYDITHSIARGFVSSFIESNKDRNIRILDLGCSLGIFEGYFYSLRNKFTSDYISDNFFIDAVDNSESMLLNAFGYGIRNNEVFKYYCDDILDYLEKCRDNGVKYDILVSLYTLQFLTKYERFEFLDLLKDVLNPDGYIILADKFVNPDSDVDLMNEKLLGFYKKCNGFGKEEIDGKRKALSGVQSRIDFNFVSALTDVLGVRGYMVHSSLNFKCYIFGKGFELL